MREMDVIREIASRFPRSPRQLNALFECDAELVTVGCETWGMTMDDFSPEEDLFSLSDPELLGSNLAVATLSDLLAAGVEPAFYMQAVSLPSDTPAGVLRAFSAGVHGVLEKAGCFLIGGDTGVSASWRYCGYAMGPVAGPRPLMRKLPAEPQSLWVTGFLGDANLAAFQRKPAPAFEFRIAEARAIRSVATACMDTSGGLLDALWTFHALNPEWDFHVDVKNVPLAPALGPFAAASGIAPEAALLGGAGEYELVVAAPIDLDAATEEEWIRLGLKRIGETTAARNGGLLLRLADGRARAMTEPPPCPRSAGGIPEHALEVMAMAASLFGKGGT